MTPSCPRTRAESIPCETPGARTPLAELGHDTRAAAPCMHSVHAFRKRRDATPRGVFLAASRRPAPCGARTTPVARGPSFRQTAPPTAWPLRRPFPVRDRDHPSRPPRPHDDALDPQPPLLPVVGHSAV